MRLLTDAIRSIALLLCCSLYGSDCLFAEEQSLPLKTMSFEWHSPTCQASLAVDVYSRKAESGDKELKLPTVVYLKNLAAMRYGSESDGSILRDFLANGYLVLTIDYAEHEDSVAGKLNADIFALRQQIQNKTLLTDLPVDHARIYVLPEGCRVKRDVAFAFDNDRTLAMDIIYPSMPQDRVPTLIEFTCDNENRMGNFSLVYCRDTLVESAPLYGFAGVMADHPVRAPYKGMDDPMPDVLVRAKLAIQTLRKQSQKHAIPISDKIGAIGFSRGGPIAAMLAVTNGNKGMMPANVPFSPTDGDVQAALVHGNRYDYSKLAADDPMLARFEKSWGKREDNEQAWLTHGAVYWAADDIAPMFLNTSDTESKEYREGLKVFADFLSEREVEHIHQVDADGRGHRVTLDPNTLSQVFEFFSKHLQ